MTDTHQNKSIKELNDILGDIRSYLDYLSDTGCRGFDCTEESIKKVSDWGNKKDILPETLEKIRKDLGPCTRCGLSERRNSIVFGVGDTHARLVFVGEGPGADEDRAGEPFVGAAGQLLTKIIHAMHLTREQVYICNIIKCRPPGNRNPLPDEIETCFPFLERQMKAIKPDFICALGAVAAQTLLGCTDPISRLRGRFHECMGARLMPTYHPSYLLRNPEKKRDVWEDMQALMVEMGISL